MTDMVNHPPHYQPLDGVTFECIELARRATFDIGNAIKYMWRTDRKNGRQDVEKARWYVKDAITAEDAIFDMSHLFGHRQETIRMLRVVAGAQSDDRRRRFFGALASERLGSALAALEEILSDEPA